jgi:tripartite ATP-independent transporter DctM subunit
MGKTTFALFGLLTLLLGAGVWIGLGLIGTGWGLTALFRPNLPVDKLLAQQAFNAGTSMELLALPLFILMAEVLFRSRLSESLFTGLAPWTRRLPGRLSHVTIIASTLFAAVSGSSAATTATVGRITTTELLARGYDRNLVIGSLAGAGTLGFLIPPSVIMIIYGVLAAESVLKLFIAGIIPGLILAGAYSGYLAVRALINPALVGEMPPPTTWAERGRALVGLAPVVFLIVLVVGSMYGGYASPTEAAAVGVAGAALIGIGQRTLTWRGMREAAVEAALTCSMIGFIIIGAVFLSVVLGYLGVPRFIAAQIQALDLSPFGLILVLLVFYILLGCVMEGMSAIVLTLPITLPLVQHAGYDKLWFGVFLVLVVEMAQITPPVGFNLIVIQRLTGDRIGRVARAALPFFFIMIAMVVLISVFPGIVGWLPSTVAARP